MDPNGWSLVVVHAKCWRTEPKMIVINLNTQLKKTIQKKTIGNRDRVNHGKYMVLKYWILLGGLCEHVDSSGATWDSWNDQTILIQSRANLKETTSTDYHYSGWFIFNYYIYIYHYISLTCIKIIKPLWINSLIYHHYGEVAVAQIIGGKSANSARSTDSSFLTTKISWHVLTHT